MCFTIGMDDAKLIEELQEKVREAAELLRRRKEALAALLGKTGSAKNGNKKRGFRKNSIPLIAHAILKDARVPMSLEDLTAQIKKVKPDITSRSVSIALSRYVRDGNVFVILEDGKYKLK